jgi:toxin ParE1/3/4
MQFELHPEAREEFLAAISWYESQVPGLGARFVAEIERCLTLLLEAPQIGSPLGPKLRRVVINDGFPYSIIYAVLRDTLYVVALAHGSRRPGYWRRRTTR